VKRSTLPPCDILSPPLCGIAPQVVHTRYNLYILYIYTKNKS
jgi:hypothetical protein